MNKEININVEIEIGDSKFTLSQEEVKTLYFMLGNLIETKPFVMPYIETAPPLAPPGVWYSDTLTSVDGGTQ